MNLYIYWAILCLAIALVLFFVEVFVPSGGLLGFLAASSLVAGIVLLFKVDTVLGLIGALVTLIAVPFFLALAVKIWPSTPIARWLSLKSTDVTANPSKPASTLVGSEGEALTDLRPVGTCLIQGQRLDCLAEGGVIEAGARVRVTSAQGFQIKVRKAT